MATMNVLNSSGGTESVEKPLAPGRAAATASRPVVLSNEDAAYLDGIETLITSTNTKLDTIDGRVDGLETLITSTNTKLDTAITALQIIDNMVLSAGTANIGDVDVLTVNGVAPAFGAGASGSTVQRVVVASDQLASAITSQGAFSAGAQQVSIPSDHPAIMIGGAAAHDAVDSGNPVKQGGKAVAGASGVTLVAAADRTDSYHGLDGIQYVRPHCGLEDIVSGVAAITDGSSTSVIAAAGSGVKNYVTTAIIANTSATAVTVDIRDGAAGTVKATLPVPANTSGVVCNLPIPIPFSANTAVCADPSASASTVTVTLIGFKSKV